jgi:hypothetical protein
MRLGFISELSFFTAILDDFKKNLQMNCIPESIFEMTALDYERFLSERRQLMAMKIKEYYNSL